ncbi:MAG: hypothetical protein WCP53_16305 [Verrucomicrobiota bacterium]
MKRIAASYGLRKAAQNYSIPFIVTLELNWANEKIGFSSFSGVNYIAYAIVGGRGALLGPVLGTGLLVWTSNLFSSQGQYSAGLFGLLIIGVVTVAPGGLIGTFARAWNGLRRGAASSGDVLADTQAAPVSGTTPAKQG